MRGAEDVTKLPAWARRRIEVAEHSVGYWKEQAGIVGGKPEDAAAFWTLGLRHEGSALPEHATVYFRLPNGRLLYVREHDGALHVAGEHQITMRPAASNLVYVGSDK